MKLEARSMKHQAWSKYNIIGPYRPFCVCDLKIGNRFILGWPQSSLTPLTGCFFVSRPLSAGGGQRRPPTTRSLLAKPRRVAQRVKPHTSRERIRYPCKRMPGPPSNRSPLESIVRAAWTTTTKLVLVSAVEKA